MGNAISTPQASKSVHNGSMMDAIQVSLFASRIAAVCDEMGAVLRREGWYPFEALEATVRETQREEIAALNLEALGGSEGLVG